MIGQGSYFRFGSVRAFIIILTAQCIVFRIDAKVSLCTVGWHSLQVPSPASHSEMATWWQDLACQIELTWSNAKQGASQQMA